MTTYYSAADVKRKHQYYLDVVKPRYELEKQYKYPKDTLRIQLHQLLPVLPEHLEHLKNARTFHKINFYATTPTNIPINPHMYTNDNLAAWVMDNYGEGYWSVRLMQHARNIFHCSYKEVMKVMITEYQDTRHFKIISIRNHRLRHYFFRKPEFQRQLKKESII